MSLITASPRPDKKARKNKDGRFRKSEESVYRATAELLLEKGFRQLRTFDIATRANITESTLFRSYGKMNELLAATYNWAWEVVVRAVSDASFIKPGNDPRESLLRDTRAVWALRAEADTALAATYAFLFFRRKNEFDLLTSVNEELFAARLKHHCKELVVRSDDADLLARFVVNYIVTVWLTWETMPRRGDDGFGRDLSQDEAQMGILVLLEQFEASRRDPLSA